MKVCFAYIHQYKNIKDVGISLDSHFLYEYDSERKVLTINDNEQHIDYFYGKNIYSLAVIAGNNGAGKSNALRFILNAVVDGVNDKSKCNGIVVYRDKNGLSYYSNDKNVRVVYNGRTVNETYYMSCQTFFYSSHSIHCIRGEDIFTEEWDGMYNATDSVRMIKDYESYVNANNLNGLRTYENYLITHTGQRGFKLLLFLKDYYMREARLEKLEIPPEVMILPNSSGYYHILDKGNVERGNKQYNGNMRSWQSLKNRVLYDFFITSLINYSCNENDYFSWQPLIESWEEFVKTNESEDIFILWDLWTKGKDHSKELNRIRDVVHAIDYTCDFDDIYGRYHLKIEGNIEKVSRFIDDVYNTREFLAARFIDTAPSYDGVNDAMMSSGEEKFLYLMAELYFSHCIHWQKFDNKKVPTLFVLDEAELGYHPEWQRKFISYLLDFFNHYKQKDIQIVLTTHSPILLSDIARQDTVLLEKEKDKPKLVENHHETFGTNIFELYRDSFFLKEGLMGEYAERVIKKILSDIENKNEVDTLRRRIQLVGDPQIRNYLTMKYASINKDGAVSLLEDQIKQIKERQ